MARRNERLLGFARHMRREPTRAEQHLWSQLRRSQLGVRFRRQEPIGPFIVDFVCLKRQFVVEVDGGVHEDIKKDLARDAWLHRHGFFVLHLDNQHVLDDIDGAIALIEQALAGPESVFDPIERGGIIPDRRNRRRSPLGRRRSPTPHAISQPLGATPAITRH